MTDEVPFRINGENRLSRLGAHPARTRRAAGTRIPVGFMQEAEIGGA